LVSQADEQKFTIVILLEVLTVSVLFFKLTLICFYCLSYNTLLKPPTGWPDKGKEKWFKSICRDKQADYNG
jgi:hypothetical protein